MKKIWSILVVVMFVFVLVACGKDDPTNPDDTKQTIALTYADWGNQEMNQRMIDKFMEKYPHIRVTLATNISGSGAEFTGSLVDAAQLEFFLMCLQLIMYLLLLMQV